MIGRLDTNYEQSKTRETISTQFMHDQWKRRTSIQLVPCGVCRVDDKSKNMKKKNFITVGQYFFWIYSNMAMAHVALKNNHTEYERNDYMIRAKLYKGLICGTQHISSIYDDEKYKLNNLKCCYCGKTENLTIDHLIPRYSGGKDCGNNLVYACKSCNSSKNKKDLLTWYLQSGKFPPILVLRRYLKLANTWFQENKYFDLPFSELENCCDLFRIDLLPYEFPSPNVLRL